MKPQIRVDLFVEQVDWKGALNRHVMYILHLPYLKVTQCNSRKYFSVWLVVSKDCQDHFNPIKVVSISVTGEELIHYPYLAKSVGNKQQFHKYVERCQVVTIDSANRKTDISGQTLQALPESALSIFPLVRQRQIKVSADELDAFVSDVRVDAVHTRHQEHHPVDV